jgi:peroxiredoxin
MSTPVFEIQVSQWFNTSKPLLLQQLKGRVVIMVAFQMLCPGCVSHAIPQLKKLHQLFRKAPVTVIGLHTVFEHHDAMQAHALKAFIHEYKLDFPIAIDAPSGSAIPQTMQALQLRGTPSTLIWDTEGQLSFHEFGHIDDLSLGAVIGQLLQAGQAAQASQLQAATAATCSVDGCE